MVLMPATKQVTTLIEVCNSVDSNTDISATWLFHSPRDDEAAFAAAAAVYEALFPRFGGCVVAASDLYSADGAGINLIHGITPDTRPQDLQAIRNHIRCNHTALHMLVASSHDDAGPSTALDDLVHRRLRVHVNRLFTLASDNTEVREV